MRETRDLLNRISKDSVLVLYQHLSRVQREENLTDLHNRIQEDLESPVPISIADSQIALVMVAKAVTGRRLIEKAVSRYLRRSLLVKDL